MGEDFTRRRYRPPQLPYVEPGGCDSRNEQWDVRIWGADSGTLDLTLTINGVTEVITDIPYDATAEEWRLKMLEHSELEEGDVITEGGPLPYSNITVEFQGDYENTDMILSDGAIPIMDLTNLEGTSFGGVITRWVAGHQK